MTPAQQLAAVRRAAKRRGDADALLREAAVLAVLGGNTFRAVAEAAGVSHPTIIRIVREAEAREKEESR